ncbi:MAG: phosphopyruvate hydratase [Prosthecobacter sp.]|uniref:phosphopyruvate hydratase n=1 Tax=Prosthecobacter sp. TaxID=1965333 RepID=UPI0025DDCA24|nr:phosphopyruvate hydratase [Prosthecobacter sp.]MCF7788216.1 phosphopyruvate hydratase [Prosthecobacter sp.]
MKISSLDALQIFDSRGNPTVEVIATLEDGTTGHGLVPSGASTGHHEALELRDGDKSRFRGKSVFKAVSHVKGEIASTTLGCNVFDQAGLDAALIALDGTPGKSRLGANAILGTSMAVAQAAANAKRIPLFESLGAGQGTLLPLPEIQIFGGGKHAQGRIDIQDFMIMALTAQSYEETLEVTSNVFHAAADVMRERGLLAGVADEGGYWPMFDRNEDVFDALMASIERAGYTPGHEVGISLDIAATDLFQDGHYTLGLDQRRFTSEQFAALMIEWVDKYPIVSIEDPMAEDDWAGWKIVRAAIGQRCQLIGDDHFTTNIERIERGIAANTANAVLIKLNQIGTVTETIAAIHRTQAAGWLPVVSARSGETEDAFIAHLAVATNAGQLKVGSFSRSERMAKWNEVLRIQRLLGSRARFIGAGIFATAGIQLP